MDGVSSSSQSNLWTLNHTGIEGELNIIHYEM